MSGGSDYDALIVGAGVAGLTCAAALQARGRSFCIVEESDLVGGRIRTDELRGFLLDRGFQVFLTSYPEPHRWLDFDKLDLRQFVPGALIRYGKRFHRFSDPWRRPRDLWSVASSPLASFADKWRVVSLRRRICRSTLEQLFERPETTTAEALRAHGFSDQIIERFFRPFLSGVFLDRELSTSSRMFEFMFRMFSLGDATLPYHGMHAIPRQLASRLPAERILVSTPVTRLTERGAILDDGRHLAARVTVVATNALSAQALLPQQAFNRAQRSVACCYYAAGRPPIEEPVLVLNGDGQGPINSMCVPSQVSPAYAPSGQSLVSVTTLAASSASVAQLEPAVREQLRSWFGPQVANWEHLRTDWIPEALPAQPPPALNPVVKSAQAAERVFVCGDHRHLASIQGAMESGRLAAEAILAKLRD